MRVTVIGSSGYIAGYLLERFRRDPEIEQSTQIGQTDAIDVGLISIKNIGLPDKLRRNTMKARARKNKRLFGDSIPQRSESIES